METSRLMITPIDELYVFTLDYYNDPHAQLALLVYANSIRNDEAAMAEELIEELGKTGRAVVWNNERQMWRFHDVPDEPVDLTINSDVPRETNERNH